MPRVRRSLFWALTMALGISLAACGGRPLERSGDGATDQRAVPDNALWADGGPAVDLAQVDAGPWPAADLLLSPAVTVWTDRRAYTTDEDFTGTLHNGLGHSIFLNGCAIFSRELREKSGWSDQGPSLWCFWEGLAREVKPEGMLSEQGRFTAPGTWRLVLVYGTGCQQGKPLSTSGCTQTAKAYSPAVQVRAAKGYCDNLDLRYASALTRARKCDAAKPAPCLVVASSDISCGCPTRVSDDAELSALQKQWTDAGCSAFYAPCGVKCAEANPPSCQANTCQ